MNVHAGKRTVGRARVIDLVVWDALLVAAAVGLVFAERAIPPRPGASAAPAPAPAAPPQPTAAPTPAPPPPRSRPGRVGAQPTPTGSEPAPTPAPATRDADAEARAALEALVIQARALVEAGRFDEAVALYTHAPPALHASHLWQTEAGPAVQRLEADRARADAWRAGMPVLEVLADAGDAAGVEARVALLPPEAREAAPVARERARAKARSGRPPAGFQIRAFTPDAARADGRRCAVEGEGELARLTSVRDAVDATLANVEAATGWRTDAPLTVKLLAEDAPLEAAGAASVRVHARAGDGPVDLADRARAAAARFALARGPSDAPGGPARATAWVREGLAQVVALSEPSGGGRPTLTPRGQAARRRALALAKATTPDALASALSGQTDIDPALAFGLCWAAGHQDERVRLLRDVVGLTVAALARGERPAAPKPSPDQARALVAGLNEILEHP